jgi:GNAT superfamily N-acetyltransferase
VQPSLDATVEAVPDVLRAHLEHWVGDWPPGRPVVIAANPRRDLPGWDGSVAPVTGVVVPGGAAVVGLAPWFAAAIPAGIGLDDLLAGLPRILGSPGGAVRAAFRWSTDPAPGPDEGVWLPSADPRVPPWLSAFGEVLVALGDDGHYLAGVGLKRHDRFGQEIAVGTRERARGRGLARRLVAQAARRVLAEGAVPTYLHDPRNLASARAAEAAGFPDRGWEAIAFFPYPPG